MTPSMLFYVPIKVEDYLEMADKIKQQGVEVGTDVASPLTVQYIFCVSVLDPYIMSGWGDAMVSHLPTPSPLFFCLNSFMVLYKDQLGPTALLPPLRGIGRASISRHLIVPRESGGRRGTG